MLNGHVTETEDIKMLEELEDRRMELLDAIEKRTRPGKPKDPNVLALEIAVRRINKELDQICKRLGLPT